MERHADRSPAEARTRGPATLLSLLLLLALVSGAVAGCGGGESAADPNAESTRKTVPVTTRTASYTERARQVSATGTVEASRTVRPGTKILGRVDAVPVEAGQRIAAGQLLARLESRDLDAAVAQARAAVASGEAGLDNARAQYERMRELESRGSATAKSLEDATSAFRRAEAEVERARAHVAAAEVDRGYAQVRSPFDGWVVETGIEVGDVVQPGRPLFTVEDLDPVKVVADVPEAEAEGFAPGTPVAIEVPGAGFESEATLTRIIPSADPGSRTFRFETVLPNPHGTLKSGTFARVRLESGTTRRVLLVPRAAVVSRGQLEGLFVVDRSVDPPRARLRWVRLGESYGEEETGGTGGPVEVLSGLAEGEEYVADPPSGLVDGSPVRPAPAPAEPEDGGPAVLGEGER